MLTLDSKCQDEVSVVYGYEVTRFGVFKDCEFANKPEDDKAKDLDEFKTKFHIEKEPKFYCIYIED